MRAAGVIAGEPDRLHHRFGARHVERDLVEPGNLAQPPHVLGDDRMVGAEHGPERMRALLADLDALLVEIVAEDVDAVGTGQVVEHIAVEIGDRHARRGLHEAAGAEMLVNQAAILERHPVGSGELQIGNPGCCFRRHRPAFGVAFPVETGEPEEAVLALGGDSRRRAVGTEEIVDIELVERDQPRYGTRHLRVSGQRAVFGARQGQPRVQFREGRGGSRRGGGKGENQNGRIHAKQR